MLWLCIQFPKLPLEVLTRALDKNAQTGALAVVEKQHIVECNESAGDRGVEPGLSIATACALSADLQLLERDSEREQQQLEQLAQWGYSFTPVVSPETASSIDNGDSRPACLNLELSGCLKANGGLRPLLEQLQEELKLMGIGSIMGLGHSPSAARMLSQLAEHRQWLARTHSAPSPQQWKQWISFSPSKLLDCDNKTIAKLYACGIKRVSQLLAIPLSEVGSRFGRSFVDYLARLNGSRQDPIPSYQPPAQFESELFFPSPLDNSEQLLFPIGRLLRELCQQLQRRQLYTQQLHWQLDFGQNQRKAFTVEISRPQLEPQRLIALTKLQLERHSLQHPAQALRLSCKKLHPLVQEEMGEDLFDEGKRDECSHQLLDKLKARLGHQALSGIALKESYLPEQAWQSADTLLLKTNPKKKGHQLTPVKAARPSWLLPRPSKLQGRGHKLFYQGELQLLQGPERIDGYWWQHGRHGRDYYIAKSEDGCLYWIFQDLTSEEWFLHGIFS
ncbi:Y-family DNA polymerase [Microbulbifer epialgicus]|uniref:DNA polymerase Y family protein n=1 Tax=Microbulbifer epialgicus TaxID=393907 RepID=A0ABV4P180_9GAMM